MKLRNITLFVLLLALISCTPAKMSTSKKISSFKKMEWLLGKWTTMVPDFTFIENWEKLNDTVFTGNSLMIMLGDTVLNEQMSIESSIQNINFYNKSLQHADAAQNSYRLSKLKDDRIEFENTSGSAQNQIIYFHKTANVMNIYVKGSDKSQASYDMKKISK